PRFRHRGTRGGPPFLLACPAGATARIPRSQRYGPPASGQERHRCAVFPGGYRLPDHTRTAHREEEIVMRTAGAGGAVEQGRPLSAGPRRSSTLGTVVFWASLGISLVLTLSFVVGALAPLVPFLVFLPAIVATVGTLQQTAIIAGWTYLVAFMVYASRDGISGQELYGLVLAAVLAVLSIAASWYRIRSAEEEYRRRSHEEEVRQLRSTVAELQRRILRPLPARVSGLIVDGHYRPVEENQMVGGDIYEVVRTPFGVRVMIADVQGKGLPAVGTAFSVLGAFRSAAYHIKDLIQLADVLDTSVMRYNIYAKQVQ